MITEFARYKPTLRVERVTVRNYCKIALVCTIKYGFLYMVMGSDSTSSIFVLYATDRTCEPRRRDSQCRETRLDAPRPRPSTVPTDLKLKAKVKVHLHETQNLQMKMLMR